MTVMKRFLLIILIHLSGILLAEAQNVKVTAAFDSSRIYIGDHYLTDLIAGYALGIAWFGLTVTLIELLFRRYYSRKEKKKLENERQTKSYK